MCIVLITGSFTGYVISLMSETIASVEGQVQPSAARQPPVSCLPEIQPPLCAFLKKMRQCYTSDLDLGVKRHHAFIVEEMYIDLNMIDIFIHIVVCISCM